MHAPFPALREWSERERACVCVEKIGSRYIDRGAVRLALSSLARSARSVPGMLYRMFCSFGRRGCACRCRDSREWRFLVRNSFVAVRGGEDGGCGGGNMVGLIGMGICLG
jgi:hypothetical protein